MGQVEEFSIPIPFQEYIEPLHEAIPLAGIVAGDVLQVGAQEDQASGALLAFGGGDSGLGALDLAFEVVALAALRVLQFFFPRFKLLLEGLLPGQQLLEFFLWLHRGPMVPSARQRDQL